MLEIQSGIPIPAIKKPGRAEKWRELADKMTPGDSVEVDYTQMNSMQASFRKWGVKFCRRKTGEDKYRVWRVA